jgi:hypothetical protein
MLTIDYLNDLEAKLKRNRLSSADAKLHLNMIKRALDEMGEDSGSEFRVQQRAYSVIDALMRVADRG